MRLKIAPLAFALSFVASPAFGAWTIDNPINASVGSATGASFGNANASQFAATPGVFTFSFDEAQGGLDPFPGGLSSNNPGLAMLPDFYGAGNGFRAELSGGGTAGFSGLIAAGSPFNTSEAYSIVTNRSELLIDFERREVSSQDRTLQAVGFTLSSFNANEGGKVEFFSDSFTTLIDTVTITQNSDADIFIGYDAGSSIISSMKITALQFDRSGDTPVQSGEQFGFDDLSISNTALATTTPPIPEPASLALVAAGGLLMASRRRRRA